MLANNPFINHAGRLRSFWRALIFLIGSVLVLFGAVGGVQSFLVVLLGANRASYLLSSSILGFVIQATLTFTVMLIAGHLAGKAMESLPFKALGVSPHTGWSRDFFIGSLIGGASLLLATLIAALAGVSLKFNLTVAPLGVIKTVTLSLIGFIWFAWAEEMWFRGYALQTLTRAGYVAVGLVLTSVPFALVHLDNPNVSLGFTFANTMLAGVWLGVAYWRTRSLWLPLGVHWAWNWMLGAVLGLPVSGITDLTPHPLLETRLAGPTWLTGGSYGIEGGAACTVALLLSSLFVWRTRWLRASAEMLAFDEEVRSSTASQSIAQPPAPPSF